MGITKAFRTEAVVTGVTTLQKTPASCSVRALSRTNPRNELFVVHGDTTLHKTPDVVTGVTTLQKTPDVATGVATLHLGSGVFRYDVHLLERQHRHDLTVVL